MSSGGRVVRGRDVGRPPDLGHAHAGMAPTSRLAALLVATLLLALLPGTAHAQTARVDLRVLLVTDGTPSIEALRGVLERVGIPVDVVDLNDPARPRIDGPLLADD